MTHSSEQDRIFVWGQTTRIYVDAHRRPASRYIATFPLTGLIFGAPRPAAGEPPVDTRGRIVPGAVGQPARRLRATRTGLHCRHRSDSRRAIPGTSTSLRFERLLSTEYEPVAQTADGDHLQTRPFEEDATRRPPTGLRTLCGESAQRRTRARTTGDVRNSQILRCRFHSLFTHELACALLDAELMHSAETSVPGPRRQRSIRAPDTWRRRGC